ncbi:hypothetical protein [Pararhodobacter oceanensis]|uniref:hypothetical protein n=1 Tax=Pararhodobacter oceanensis TaxID=2172121 RepID=UPI003A8FC3F4
MISRPSRPATFRARFQAALSRPALGGAVLALALAMPISAAASSVVQDWIPSELVFPDDIEVVTDRAIGSSIRMFAITTEADLNALFGDWMDSLSSTDYSVSLNTEDRLGQSIEFSGPGIFNAKIIAAPVTDEGRSIIEFDATLN